jgi:crotonobetainyl-CoA:carnitine CoA-transferase CaiB-like acyl-CoA transferase
MRPLEDIRVIAIEQYGAGPFGSVHLADMGAEVIKIEDPRTGGDIGRYVPPFQEGEDSLFFETFNRNKKSVSLDLATSSGRLVFHDLVKVSDAVYSNLRGDIPEHLGITYDQLKAYNPAIVCCSLSGFGMTGPMRAEPAYDYILQGIAGWMLLTGEPGGPPTKTGLSLVDYCGGAFAALALLTGIHAARRDGCGMDCDLSLFDVAMGLLTYPATWHLTRGYVPLRAAHSAHPSLVPFQNFETADGWIVVACPKEKFWRRLAAASGHPELANDARFVDFAARRANREILVPLLAGIFRSRTSAEWLRTLRTAGIPTGPVNDMPAALADPQTLARELIVETDHPRWGAVRQVRSPLRVGEPAEYSRAPFRNEHAGAILGDLLGYPTARIMDLATAGAFGSPDPSSGDAESAPAGEERR